MCACPMSFVWGQKTLTIQNNELSNTKNTELRFDATKASKVTQLEAIIERQRNEIAELRSNLLQFDAKNASEISRLEKIVQQFVQQQEAERARLQSETDQNHQQISKQLDHLDQKMVKALTENQNTSMTAAISKVFFGTAGAVLGGVTTVCATNAFRTLSRKGRKRGFGNPLAAYVITVYKMPRPWRVIEGVVVPFGMYCGWDPMSQLGEQAGQCLHEITHKQE